MRARTCWLPVLRLCISFAVCVDGLLVRPLLWGWLADVDTLRFLSEAFISGLLLQGVVALWGVLMQGLGLEQHAAHTFWWYMPAY